ncbi:MAG: hypothetical protein RLZZ628_19 [Bacteroidota bacterium]|jgi:hypothetical protein
MKNAEKDPKKGIFFGILGCQNNVWHVAIYCTSVNSSTNREI